MEFCWFNVLLNLLFGFSMYTLMSIDFDLLGFAFNGYLYFHKVLPNGLLQYFCGI